MNTLLADTPADIPDCVARALQEDIGSGDITAMLIPEQQQAKGEVLCRQHAVICGTAWVDEVFKQLDPKTTIHWFVQDGEQVTPDQLLFTLSGNARILLTGERTALNFLQLLSGTATLARQYAALTAGSEVKILDTRKTIPGLRLAQKYAVGVGGCDNHRIGLYDAFLIKENHISACGGIALAVAKAREIAPEKLVEVEVENSDELNQALDARADVVMLDNFSPSDIENLKHLNFGETKIEVSGNITNETVQQYISSAVNYISSGSLTKHVQAVDLSMRFTK
ncbi:MAG: carboxylating nicotinate-nucleotide diphosphorylase [Porticoccaceae bacterium]|nr:carboxylating nicotinate-nucleotide diphosphorylase [Porticoccaceae bacterium]MBT4164750.1 carboxylating nicotinate-nucleotide diphosphorylase [Porticoccaceae bacterium]MBT4591801.1 carboxylating nicotinate-nucleotide diphosphorylase [Porticoccaceae bacterium]MBT5004718.1 carboxylating nicotinate-nucleotide diphosphorylase [Porticoccaceae bacterium]MBT5102435.1 carboxylating nicotinate-nucleotide diphosphorylase [Porticoccaceae bacterium]